MTKPTAVIHGVVRNILAPDLKDALIASVVYGNLSSSVSPLTVINAHRSKDQAEMDRVAMILAMPEIARDRILHLSQRLEQAEALLKKVVGPDSIAGLSSEIEKFLAAPKTEPSEEPDIWKRK